MRRDGTPATAALLRELDALRREEGDRLEEGCRGGVPLSSLVRRSSLGACCCVLGFAWSFGHLRSTDPGLSPMTIFGNLALRVLSGAGVLVGSLWGCPDTDGDFWLSLALMEAGSGDFRFREGGLSAVKKGCMRVSWDVDVGVKGEA